MCSNNLILWKWSSQGYSLSQELFVCILSYPENNSQLFSDRNMAEGRVGLRGSWCERGHVVTLPFEDHIKPPTLHRPKFRFEMSSMVYMKRCSSFCHSPKTIISIPIKNTCGAFAGICTVQLRLLLIFLRIQDYKYRQTWWLFRLPSSTDYEEPRAENTKASCVPRSDVVGAQPEVILDCW